MKQPFQCPCSGITSCTACAQRPGCGYCKTNSTFVNMYQDKNGDGVFFPKVSECAEDSVATSASQCMPGAKLGNVRSESGGYKPSDDELGMTQNNTLLGGNELNAPGSYEGPRGTGAGAVSPPRTSRYVSGNGVIRRYGDSSVPGGISRSADLSVSPVEDYVKLLVRSELASEGIPMNEPFQVNEKDAPGNATDYLKKSFNNVFA